MTQQKTTSNISKNIHYRLSVQVSLTGLSFLVKDIENQEILYFSEKNIGSSATAEELLLEIDTILTENEMFQLKFDEVIVLYSNNITARLFGISPFFHILAQFLRADMASSFPTISPRFFGRYFSVQSSIC